LTANQRQGLERCLLDAIDETLSLVLSERIKEAIYSHMEKYFDLRREEIPRKLDLLASCLEKIFGRAALDGATVAAGHIKIANTQSGFRAYSKDAIQNLEVTEFGMGAVSEILMKAEGLRLAEVPVSCKYKGVEGSTYNPVTHALSVLGKAARWKTISWSFSASDRDSLSQTSPLTTLTCNPLRY